MSEATVALVGPGDLEDLLPLMRAYCDFYEADPADEDLMRLSRALVDDPDREGLQLIARLPGGAAVGFATIYWSWSTTGAARIGVMNDLFVAADARGSGLAEELIEACRAECARRGARRLTWQTAPDNLRAQAVYDRVGRHARAVGRLLARLLARRRRLVTASAPSPRPSPARAQPCLTCRTCVGSITNLIRCSPG